MTQWVYTKEVRIDFDNFILDQTVFQNMSDAMTKVHETLYKEKIANGEVFPNVSQFPSAIGCRDVVGRLHNLSSAPYGLQKISIFFLVHTYSQATYLIKHITESFQEFFNNAVLLEDTAINDVNIPIDYNLAYDIFDREGNPALPYIGRNWKTWNDLGLDLSGTN